MCKIIEELEGWHLEVCDRHYGLGFKACGGLTTKGEGFLVVEAPKLGLTTPGMEEFLREVLPPFEIVKEKKKGGCQVVVAYTRPKEQPPIYRTGSWILEVCDYHYGHGIKACGGYCGGNHPGIVEIQSPRLRLGLISGGALENFLRKVLPPFEIQ